MPFMQIELQPTTIQRIHEVAKALRERTADENTETAAAGLVLYLDILLEVYAEDEASAERARLDG